MLSWLASLSVVSQAALWGLFAIAIPVLIHLINPSKGKLVWVGNIELIKKAKQARVNQFKIKRWLLLLIRVLIVIYCCLLLADLWSSSIGQASKKPRLLITPAWLNNANEQDKHELIEKNIGVEFIILDGNNSKIDSVALFDK
ncbi:MAG: BatA domain-containing protein, partial [Kangiellaceae bacterium]|nr:BatA domain-containing protein [Kangiellaceae bacterium]